MQVAAGQQKGALRIKRSALAVGGPHYSGAMA